MERAAKIELEALAFKSCTNYISQKQNLERMRKRVKQTKNKEKVKNDEKTDVARYGRPNDLKQSILRGPRRTRMSRGGIRDKLVPKIGSKKMKKE